MPSQHLLHARLWRTPFASNASALEISRRLPSPNARDSTVLRHLQLGAGTPRRKANGRCYRCASQSGDSHPRPTTTAVGPDPPARYMIERRIEGRRTAPSRWLSDVAAGRRFPRPLKRAVFGMARSAILAERNRRGSKQSSAGGGATGQKVRSVLLGRRSERGRWLAGLCSGRRVAEGGRARTKPLKFHARRWPTGKEWASVKNCTMEKTASYPMRGVASPRC